VCLAELDLAPDGKRVDIAELDLARDGNRVAVDAVDAMPVPSTRKDVRHQRSTNEEW
jgi:hypothetical protein